MSHTSAFILSSKVGAKLPTHQLPLIEKPHARNIALVKAAA
jgi:hypothetical protein